MKTKKFKRIVIWGLRKKWHTHRFIHKAFYDNAKKLGYEAIWVEDEKENQRYIQPGDLIITAEPVGKMVPEKSKFEDYNLPARDDVFYCLHNVKSIFSDKLNPRNYIRLQVYHKIVPQIEGIQKWGPATYFDATKRTLYQPWGTDLLAEEFKKPVFNKNPLVFWVGSVWNNSANQGNVEVVNELDQVLKKNHLKFVQLRFIPDFMNRFFIRMSRIAPAIGGNAQVETDYLPCRMFKNISYGQLGITNVKKFKDILGDSYVEGDTIAEVVEMALSLSKEEYLDKVKTQQEIIKKYTYKESLENIFKALA